MEPLALFVSECGDRVWAGDQKCVASDGGERNYNRNGRSAQEYPGSEFDVISKTFEPALHDEVSRRPCDEVGPQDGLCELPEKQSQYIGAAGRHRFAYPDF